MSKRATKVKLRLRMTGTIESDDGNEYRWQKMDREPTVPEVVEWLREQGAIDYERAIYAFRTTPFPGSGAEYAENVVVAIVDAALRPPVSSSRDTSEGEGER